MNTLHSILIFLEGKKMTIGSIALAIIAFLLGRHVIATDTVTLILAILSALGFTAAGVGATKSYQAVLGRKVGGLNN